VLDTDAREALLGARLYLVCPALADATLCAALDGGVDLVQLRIKDATDDDLITAGCRYARICAERGVPLILNDRPDLVAAVGADGVHLGQEDMPVADARAILGEGPIVGLSTHTPQQISAAGEQALDYIGVGPVHATPTKPGRPAVGSALVEYAAAHADAPFFAIGGLGVEQIDAVVRAGARRIAVVRAVTDAPDPGAAARALLEALERAVSVAHG
jgi:thiamine-phosphate pyrophosphorylase